MEFDLSLLDFDDAVLEADDDDNASTTDAGSVTGATYCDTSDSRSIAQSIYRGHIENGRRYQSYRDDQYWGPSDELQFETMNKVHLMALVLDSRQDNPLFRSPFGDGPENVLDIGTGSGAWATAVADAYPNAKVRGIDLFPVPNTWVPTNCVFEVEDATKTWTFSEKFDLVHLRLMVGAFTLEEWEFVYRQAYENMAPGGWIEHFDCRLGFFCDDDTMPANSLIGRYGEMFCKAFEAMGKPGDMETTMRRRIEGAGFTNIHEKTYKIPMGAWVRDPVWKEVGKLNEAQFEEGSEGYVLHALTRHGQPQPWTPTQVQHYLEQLRREMSMGWHTYWKYRRVWAQKPFPEAVKHVQSADEMNLD